MQQFYFKNNSLPLGQTTYVMGILNVTPDSFSDGGEFVTPQNALAATLSMQGQGASFIDVGGQSTRPGCSVISAKEEWDRLKEVLPLLLQEVALPISVDTFYPEVAEQALALGCHMINDVSGVVNPKMGELIVKHSAGWVLTHNRQEKGNNIVQVVHSRLAQMAKEAETLGVPPQNICLDPGIGFGKSHPQNAALILNTAQVKVQGYAYLLGASRKRVIAHSLPNLSPDQRDSGTVAAHTIGILGGADIIRVHNCAMAVQAARVADDMIHSGKGVF